MYSHGSGRKRGSPDAANGNGSVPFKRSKDMESNQVGLGSKSKPCTKFFRTPSSIQSENILFMGDNMHIEVQDDEEEDDFWKYFVRQPSENEVVDRGNTSSVEATIKGGTQKTYKKTEAVKVKRRLYEAKRRRSSKKEVVDGNNSEGDMDCKNEAYVHEAFLADSEAASSKNIWHMRLQAASGEATIRF